MTTIINFIGGPGSGKSTSAAYAYYLLKAGGKNVELVREYVKEWAYEARQISTYDQIYLLGKQARKESFLYSKVDWIITDSPVLIGAFYAEKYCPKEFAAGVRATALAFYQQAKEDGHKHIFVNLKRNKEYKNEGRYQDEAEAKQIDIEMERLLSDLKIEYHVSTPDESEILKLMNLISGSKLRVSI